MARGPGPRPRLKTITVSPPRLPCGRRCSTSSSGRKVRRRSDAQPGGEDRTEGARGGIMRMMCGTWSLQSRASRAGPA